MGRDGAESRSEKADGGGEMETKFQVVQSCATLFPRKVKTRQCGLCKSIWCESESSKGQSSPLEVAARLDAAEAQQTLVT